MATPDHSQFSFEFKFDPKQLDSFLNKIKFGTWSPGINRLIKNITEDMTNVAKKAAYPHPGMDTGRTRDSIMYTIKGFNAEIYSNQRSIQAIEFGRRPGGRMPPVDVIEEWAERHGMPGAGWPIARKIATKGTKGLEMFRKAYDYGRMVTSARARAAGTDIESIWRRFR